MRLLLLALVLTLSFAACQPTPPVDYCDYGAVNPLAPPQTSQYQFLLGDWRMEDRYMQPNGEWGPPSIAYWRGEYALGGFAITDFWYDAPPEEAASADKRGINVRMIDTTTGYWNIMWQHTRGGPVSTFQSEFREGEMHMWSPKNTVNQAKIRFYNLAEESWDWVVETSADSGATWQPIEHLHAERLPCRSPLKR